MGSNVDLYKFIFYKSFSENKQHIHIMGICSKYFSTTQNSRTYTSMHTHFYTRPDREETRSSSSTTTATTCFFF